MKLSTDSRHGSVQDVNFGKLSCHLDLTVPEEKARFFELLKVHTYSIARTAGKRPLALSFSLPSSICFRKSIVCQDKLGTNLRGPRTKGATILAS
jgi:hypothetical protein